MNVSIIGTGYVGLVTGVGLTMLGHQVVCADIDGGKVEELASGRLPIWEPGLGDALAAAQGADKIRFTTDIASAVRASEVLILAVGTPSLSDGEADLTYVWDAVQAVTEFASDALQLLIIKSTVPVGTTDAIAEVLTARCPDKPMLVMHNPEFLRQGNALQDFLKPSRLVAGCKSDACQPLFRELYAGLEAPMQFCTPQSAEMIKYASNAFLAMKISYINMFAELCEHLDASVDDVARGMGFDPRIGGSFLQAGIGYGGSCFPKDIRALRKLGEKLNCDVPLLKATEALNTRQPERLVRRVADALGGLHGRRVTLLGLSFKAETDDVRESPSLMVAASLLAAGAEVVAYDPVVRRFPLEAVRLCADSASALDGSDAAILLTDWQEFRSLDWGSLKSRMHFPLIADGRNLYSLEEAERLRRDYGMLILSVGRPAVLDTELDAELAWLSPDAAVN